VHELPKPITRLTWDNAAAVLAGLFVLTGVTTATAYLDLGAWNAPVMRVG
jgi:hypothetical protein